MHQLQEQLVLVPEQQLVQERQLVPLLFCRKQRGQQQQPKRPKREIYSFLLSLNLKLKKQFPEIVKIMRSYDVPQKSDWAKGLELFCTVTEYSPD